MGGDCYSKNKQGKELPAKASERKEMHGKKTDIRQEKLFCQLKEPRRLTGGVERAFEGEAKENKTRWRADLTSL